MDWSDYLGGAGGGGGGQVAQSKADAHVDYGDGYNQRGNNNPLAIVIAAAIGAAVTALVFLVLSKRG